MGVLLMARSAIESAAYVCCSRNDQHTTAEAVTTSPESSLPGESAVPEEKSAANGLASDTVSESPPNTVTEAENAPDNEVMT